MRKLLRLVKPKTATTHLRYGEGPVERMAAPVHASDTMIIQRAQSILSGPLIGACPPITVDQARDVLRWHTGRDTL